MAKTLTRYEDMLVVGEPPERLRNAIATVSANLHSTFNEFDPPKAGLSKLSCIISSLAVRDFLLENRIDAEARSVIAAFSAMRDGQRQFSGTIGIQANDKEWNGHLVVIAEGYLLDTTLYRLPTEWKGPRGMLAVPTSNITILNRPSVAHLAVEKSGATFDIGWLDNVDNDTWTSASDASNAIIKRVVERLLERHQAQPAYDLK